MTSIFSALGLRATFIPPRAVSIVNLSTAFRTATYSTSSTLVSSSTTSSSSSTSFRRSFATAHAGSYSDKPDYYKVLGINRDASADQIKQAFREQAKLHHPDTRRTTTSKHEEDNNLLTFKLINEAYATLGNATNKKQYDAEKFGNAGRGVSLRARNEGYDDLERPKSIYEAGPTWRGVRGRSSTVGGAGVSGMPLPSSSSSSSTTTTEGENTAVVATQQPIIPEEAIPTSTFTREDSQEAFRISMERASERQKDNAKMRASLARLSRAKIDLPTREGTIRRLAISVAVAGIWVVNYFLFIR